MPQVVKIKDTWFEVINGTSLPKFEGGKLYPLNDETQRQVELGNGEIVDAPEDAEKAQAAADAAAAAAAKAAEKATEKADAAAAAVAAAQLGEAGV